MIYTLSNHIYTSSAGANPAVIAASKEKLTKAEKQFKLLVTKVSCPNPHPTIVVLVLFPYPA